MDMTVPYHIDRACFAVPASKVKLVSMARFTCMLLSYISRVCARVCLGFQEYLKWKKLLLIHLNIAEISFTRCKHWHFTINHFKTDQLVLTPKHVHMGETQKQFHMWKRNFCVFKTSVTDLSAVLFIFCCLINFNTHSRQINLYIS